MTHSVEKDARLNTDRELFREGGGDGNGQSYYEPSVHVTAAGEIGMNVGGTVVTLPIREWHAAALAQIRMEAADDAPPIGTSVEKDAPGEDLVTWVMPREDARDLLGWLRRNRPLGMPDRTFEGLMDALATRPISPTSDRGASDA